MIENSTHKKNESSLALKILLPLAVLIFIITAFFWLKSFKKEVPKRETEEVIRSLKVSPVNFVDVSPELKILGRINSKDQVNIIPEVSGKILSWNFKLRTGQNFYKGQPLVAINSESAKNALKIQISNLMNGVSELLPDMKVDIPDAYPKWESFFNELSFDKIPELPQYESEKEKMYLTRFNVFTLYYSAKNQHTAFSKYIIYAPFSGTVASSNTSPGNLASMGMNLAQIVRTDVYEMTLPLTQAEMSKVKIGMKIDVKLSSTNELIKGKIVRLSSVLNQANQTMEAIVEIRKPRGNTSLANGAYAEATIKGNLIKNTFVISRNALYQGKYALVIKDPTMIKRKDLVVPAKKSGDKPTITKRKPIEVGKLDIREVEISFLGNDKAYIVGGLKKDELVVFEATQDVMANAKVTPLRVVSTEKTIEKAGE